MGFLKKAWCDSRSSSFFWMSRSRSNSPVPPERRNEIREQELMFKHDFVEQENDRRKKEEARQQEERRRAEIEAEHDRIEFEREQNQREVWRDYKKYRAAILGETNSESPEYVPIKEATDAYSKAKHITVTNHGILSNDIISDFLGVQRIKNRYYVIKENLRAADFHMLVKFTYEYRRPQRRSPRWYNQG